MTTAQRNRRFRNSDTGHTTQLRTGFTRAAFQYNSRRNSSSEFNISTNLQQTCNLKWNTDEPTEDKPRELRCGRARCNPFSLFDLILIHIMYKEDHVNTLSIPLLCTDGLYNNNNNLNHNIIIIGEPCSDNQRSKICRPLYRFTFLLSQIHLIYLGVFSIVCIFT